jgi:hypothetical protein
MKGRTDSVVIATPFLRRQIALIPRRDYESHARSLPAVEMFGRFYFSPEKQHYFFSEIVIDARVVSQSRCIVHVSPAWSNDIVKFSSGEGSFDTCIGIRA